jgi:hypothetical protein
LKFDALYVTAALIALAVTAAMTVHADGTDIAAPVPAVTAPPPTLTAISPAAGTRPGAPSAELSPVWDLGPHGAADVNETATDTAGQGEPETPHSGAQHSAD